MKARVDAEKCVGCGLCADTCPEVFEMEGGLARVIAEVVVPSSAESCRKAAEDCPVEAIELDDGNG